MKRTCKVIQHTLILLFALAMPGIAAERALELGSIEAAPGSTVTAWISLNDAAGLAAVAFQVNYDRNLLTFVGATNYPGTLGGQFGLDVEDADGVLVCRLYRDSHLTSGSGDLLAFSFAVNSGAEPGMSASLVLAATDMVNQYAADLRWEANVRTRSSVFTVREGGSSDVLFVRNSSVGGKVTGHESGLYPPHSHIEVAAEPDSYFYFTGWSGDIEGDPSAPEMALVLYRPRTVTANFAPHVTTNTGTPHWWLAEHGLTNFNDDAMSDGDFDHMFTWQEWIAGTDPTNDLSVLSITNLTPSPSWFVLHWPSVSNRVYGVDRATNLVVPGFEAIATNLPASPPVNVYTDQVPAMDKVFYRIKVERP